MPTNEAGEANENETPNGGEPQGGQQAQQQDPTPGEGGNGGQQQAPPEPVITKDTKIPDDHPLVKALAKANGQLTELAEARAQAKKATQLQEELDKRPTPEALETLQARYDRLESFLQGAGGPLAKALDSRTFTRDLFETDKDVAEIIKDWQRANPTATTTALGSGSAKPADKKPDMNKLLRAAIREAR